MSEDRTISDAEYIAALNRDLMIANAQRDDAVEALRALWNDIREVDKRFVPDDVLAKVKAVLDA